MKLDLSSGVDVQISLGWFVAFVTLSGHRGFKAPYKRRLNWA
jgi:hypothetical protein